MFTRDKINYALKETDPNLSDQFNEISFGFWGNLSLLILTGLAMVVATPFLIIYEYIRRK
ncbi:MAG: hypothetical protein ACK4VO_10375 [Pseudobdellovibrio sp.]